MRTSSSTSHLTQPRVHPVIDPDDQPTGEWDLFVGGQWHTRHASREAAVTARRSFTSATSPSTARHIVAAVVLGVAGFMVR